jgi:hypothetical protein
MPLQHDRGMKLISNRAAAGSRSAGMTTSSHRHRWVEESAHRVSDGLVIYQRCLCGRWRVIAPSDTEHVAEVG